MKYGKFLITTLVTLISIQLNAAYAAVDACPSIEALKKVPLNWADGHPGEQWVTSVEGQKYDTKYINWELSMELKKANDRTDALHKANKALKTITLLDGPRSHQTYWGCTYLVSDPNIYEVTARCYYEICFKPN